MPRPRPWHSLAHLLRVRGTVRVGTAALLCALFCVGPAIGCQDGGFDGSLGGPHPEPPEPTEPGLAGAPAPVGFGNSDNAGGAAQAGAGGAMGAPGEGPPLTNDPMDSASPLDAGVQDCADEVEADAGCEEE